MKLLALTQKAVFPKRSVASGLVDISLFVGSALVAAATAVFCAYQFNKGHRHRRRSTEKKLARLAETPWIDFSILKETLKHSPSSSENLVNLLFNISEDQARKMGYIHRGITCNHCNISPIRGLRYKCSTCTDFDICEQCEALDDVHVKTHVLLKIRIPVPPLANPRNSLHCHLYPSEDATSAAVLPKFSSFAQMTVSRWNHVTHLDPSEIEALFDQFLVLSSRDEIAEKTLKSADQLLPYYITVDAFLRCLGPLGTEKNLITERLFRFFDHDCDGRINFDDFLHGLGVLTKGSLEEKATHAFYGYDLDEDGYLSKEDLASVFKAYFHLSMELVRDVVKAMEEEMMAQFDDEEVSKPVSASFTAPIPASQRRPSSYELKDSSLSAGRKSLQKVKEEMEKESLETAQDALREKGKQRASTDDSKESTHKSSHSHNMRRRSMMKEEDLDKVKSQMIQSINLRRISGNDRQQNRRISSIVTTPVSPSETWPVMEAMSQDAIDEMVEKTMTAANTSKTGKISLDEFRKYVTMNDASLIAWFECLGTVF